MLGLKEPPMGKWGALMCPCPAEAGAEALRPGRTQYASALCQLRLRPATLCAGALRDPGPLRGRMAREDPADTSLWKAPCGETPGRHCPQLNFYRKKFKAVSLQGPEAVKGTKAPGDLRAVLSGMKKDQGMCRWSLGAQGKRQGL